MDDLSPELRGLLASAAPGTDLPAGAEARMWERIREGVGPRGGGGGGTTVSGVAKVVASVAGGIAAAAVIAAMLRSEPVEPPPPASSPPAVPAASVAAMVQEEHASSPARPPANPAPPAPVTVSTASASPTKPAQRSPRPARAPARRDQARTGDDIAQELKLLRGAQRDLRDDRPGAALRAVKTHRRRFEDGHLAELRDALEVSSLCALGREQAARAAASTFLKRHGASPYASRVRDACTDGGPPSLDRKGAFQ